VPYVCFYRIKTKQVLAETAGKPFNCHWYLPYLWTDM